MKRIYVENVIENGNSGKQVAILGWIKYAREHKNVIFLDVEDSTGVIQAVVSTDSNPKLFEVAQEIKPESSVLIEGTLSEETDDSKEIQVSHIETIGEEVLDISPKPRQNFDTFASKFADLTLRKRHLYLRNPKIKAVMQFRDVFFKAVRQWFHDQEFLEIHAPTLTKIPLYEDDTAFSLDFFGDEVFLTQCSAFYLESAVHSFEKVYNLGPSFRAEKSKGGRHLAEYWHVKAEIAFADLEDIIGFTERMIRYLVSNIIEICSNELEELDVEVNPSTYENTPFPRISYTNALSKLKSKGVEVEWGRDLASQAETYLSDDFETLFWITGLPSETQPFPYSIDPENPRTTKTADLVAPGGYGEILGVAEKIWQHDQLEKRALEKREEVGDRYKWYFELRKHGSVPHSGFGMGVERLIRWLLKLNHVREAIPFPRLFQRSPYP